MDQDLIVLLDQQHRPIGSAPKLASHHATTPLHLAFSSYLFNKSGQLLVTKRADSKKVWPGVWTNTCCGHPAPGESMPSAIARRLDYELGITASDVRVVLPDYTYKTPPFNGIIENEFCPVYFARAITDPQPNPLEVSEWEWMDWDEYVTRLDGDTSDTWSWWCKDQLKALATSDAASAYIAEAAS